ncbi:hypothetical protein H7I41_10835 [Mycobacterium manitobense]|uniref:Uncharacterized protein n=1 Tax=[Mycobacterium] manitobense TaxID=190147 RepID=A0A9X2YMB8_9MYCO|nr:hypothetical protein [[Mycobacterium] manitobense]MCV7170409.1 hypothetical protein [[Mycobacterium] manitobense]
MRQPQPVLHGPAATGEVLYQTPSGFRYTDSEILEREYDVDASVTNLPILLAVFAERTNQARADLPATFGIPFGPTVDERLDVFPGRTGGPVVVFLHGGYWRSLTGGTSVALPWGRPPMEPRWSSRTTPCARR